MTLSLLLVKCGNERDQNIVASINGEVITIAELNHWMLLEKSKVYNYFFRKYGVHDSDHFWTEKQGNEIPLEKLKKAALKSVKRCKIEQILALKKGILKTANFDEIIKEMKIVNADRIQKTENHEPIYGPKQFTHRTYFSHVHDKMKEALKKQLSKKELHPNKKEMDSLKIKEADSGKNIINFLIMQYVDNKYEKYIDKLTLQADIKIDEKVYRQINIY